MEVRPSIRIRFVRRGATRAGFLRKCREALRRFALRLLFGSYVHVRVASPGDINCTVNMERESEVRE